MISALKDLFGVLDRQYRLALRIVECNNEILRHSGIPFAFLYELHIRIEPPAQHTPAQNGSAEVVRSIIKAKASGLRIGARLPEYLWVEIYHNHLVLPR